jgi:predicted metal-dependent HD superfamily phosphohydrolase
MYQIELKDLFFETFGSYTSDHLLIEKHWKQLHAQYNAKGRYYHNLDHLQHICKELIPLQQEFSDWNALVFALFYHDVIYSATASDNEAQSAQLALEILKSLAVPDATVSLCEQMILATKTHEYSSNEEINLFVDADMAILGQDWAVYLSYSQNVRKEYSIYPDLLYNPGRMKVLKHFLTMPNIYKTELFQNRYEQAARSNVQKEITLLSS